MSPLERAIRNEFPDARYQIAGGFHQALRSFRIVLQRNESRLELKKADTSQSV